MLELVVFKDAKRPDGDWDRLMAAALKGDAHAYRQLLGELVPWLRRYYYRRLPPCVMEDAVQDVLLALHEKRHTYDPSKPFGPWLAAIARYKWIDRLRSLKRESAEPLDDDIEVPDHEASIVAESTFEQLMGELKPAQAKVIRLVKIEGYSLEEASRSTGQSVALVKVNIHRGLKHLASAARIAEYED
jgi:RNA polymerase sigma factor (sigma-70 family)